MLSGSQRPLTPRAPTPLDAVIRTRLDTRSMDDQRQREAERGHAQRRCRFEAEGAPSAATNPGSETAPSRQERPGDRVTPTWLLSVPASNAERAGSRTQNRHGSRPERRRADDGDPAKCLRQDGGRRDRVVATRSHQHEAAGGESDTRAPAGRAADAVRARACPLSSAIEVATARYDAWTS